jgi:ribosomal protein S12 methylthiotransferase
MKTKEQKNNINVITLGCSKNTYDSEILMGQLKNNGAVVNHESDDESSDIVIINTCGFIENAKQESIDTILQQVENKKNGLIKKVYVTGCLSERYKEDLQNEISEVDKFFGTNNLKELLEELKFDYKKQLLNQRKLTTPRHYAHLKISEGCNRKCSFCAIPQMRGKHISKKIEDIVDEASELAKKGIKEILLIAQDLSYYGVDIYKKRKLYDLLVELSKVDGIEWIRLHYVYPTGFPSNVIELINKNEKICSYIDMPLQHINDKILKSMRRSTTKKRTNELIKKIRKSKSNISIRTTVIVGYPGETNEIFNELKSWVMESKFERLGVFKYSHEEDTHAYNLIDDVDQEEKQRRYDEIMSIQKDISLSINKNKIGSEIKVLIDRFENGFYYARTEFDSPEVDNEVIIRNAEFLRVGSFTKVKIVDANYYDLFAEII